MQVNASNENSFVYIILKTHVYIKKKKKKSWPELSLNIH